MAPHITQVHIKDALIVKEQGGLGHKACISGQGDMPFEAGARNDARPLQTESSHGRRYFNRG